MSMARPHLPGPSEHPRAHVRREQAGEQAHSATAAAERWGSADAGAAQAAAGQRAARAQARRAMRCDPNAAARCVQPRLSKDATALKLRFPVFVGGACVSAFRRDC